MKDKTVKVDPDVREVLRHATFSATSVGLPDAGALGLPPGQLPRKLYDRVNKVLGAAGGKWDRKLGVHRFEIDPRETLQPYLEGTEIVHRQQTLQDFPTPRWITEQIVELLRSYELRKDALVLEPSAGRGELASVFYEQTKIRPFCVEIDKTYAFALVERGYQVAVGDFMSVPLAPVFDAAVMNPPYRNGQDATHVVRAFELLRPGGVLVAVVPPMARKKTTGAYDRFNYYHRQYSALVDPIPIPAGSFADTEVAAEIIVLRHPSHDHRRTIHFNEDGSCSLRV